MSDPRDRGVYTSGAVCDECGGPSPRVRVCGYCQLAERIHDNRDALDAELRRSLEEMRVRVADLEAERDRWVARVKVLEARQERAARVLSGHETEPGVARKGAPVAVHELPGYWDAKRAESGQAPSTCAAELRQALDVSGPPRAWSEPGS